MVHPLQGIRTPIIGWDAAIGDVEGENVAAAASDGDTDLIGKVAARGKPLMTHQPPRR